MTPATRASRSRSEWVCFFMGGGNSWKSQSQLTYFFRISNKISKSAIQSLFVKPSYPTVPLEPLQSEQVLQENRDSGWRDDPFRERLCDMGFATPERAIAWAVEPTTSDRDKEKPIPNEGDRSSFTEFVFTLTLFLLRNSVDEVANLHLYRCVNRCDFWLLHGFHSSGSTKFKSRTRFCEGQDSIRRESLEK